MSTADHRSFTALPSTEAAPAMARRRVAAACLGWPEVAVETALILTSEIVTNAVRYGGGAVQLFIAVTQGLLHVEASDDSPLVPRLTSGSPFDVEGGRGLLIVSELATDWGARPRADSGGKIVWFDLRLQ